MPLAVAVGALTHLVWDVFTHPDRWGAEHVPWLRETHVGLLGSAWAQYLSGGLGLVVTAAWTVASLRARTRRTRASRVPELGVTSLAFVLLATTAIAGASAFTRAADGLLAVALRGAVLGTIVLVIGVLTLAAVWKVRARRVLLGV